MSVKDTKEAYGSVTRTLHWVMSVLMLTLIAVGFLLAEKMVPDAARGDVMMLHKSFGIVVLVLVIVRITWRLTQLTPALDHVPSWQRIAARGNILFLYVAMLGFPLSGLGMSLFSGRSVSVFNVWTIPAFEKTPELSGLFYQTHVVLAYAILASLAAHIGGAIYHHVVLKDHVFSRMWRGRERSTHDGD